MGELTGATEEQIREAIRRHCAHLWSFAELPPPDDNRIRAWLDRTAIEHPSYPVDYWAPLLVQPHQMIVDRADVAALIEAAEAALAATGVDGEGRVYFDCTPAELAVEVRHITPDLLERLKR